MTYQMQPAIYSDSTDTKWFHAPWIRELFESHPEVLEVAMRKESSGAFGYDYYYICVQAQVDQVLHRYVQRAEFNISVLRTFLSALVDGNVGTAWMDGSPTNDLIDVVSRASLGLGPCTTLDVLTRRHILQEHSEWMVEVLKQFTNITHIGKRGNVLASPNTFMFVRKNTDAVSGVTWMADPTLDRLAWRIKSREQRGRWTRYDGPDSKDAKECSNIYTRAEIFEAAGVVDEADANAKHQRDMAKAREEYENLKCCICDGKADSRYKYIELDKHPGLGKNHFCGTCMNQPNDYLARRIKERRAEAAKPAEPVKADDIVINPPNPICAGCGCSLSTNQAFGRGLDAMVCGECELKAEAEHGTERMVQDSLVFTCRKVYLPPAVQPTRFDPRPGIDDVGLGFYSPTWED